MKNKKFLVSLLAGIMALIMVLSLIAGLLPRASAASSSEIKDQINNMEKEQEEMQKQIDALKAQQKENLTEIQDICSQKSIIEQQVGLLHEQIDSMNEQIAAYALLIAAKQEELDEAAAHLAELNEKNKERIRAMEEDGAVSYWSVLFQANSFSDLLDQLLAKGEEYEALVYEQEQKLSEIENEIAQKEADYDKAKYQEWLATSVPPTTKPAVSSFGGGTGGSAANMAGVTWLVPSSLRYVSRGWGYRTHPVLGTPNTFHNGIDLATGCPTQIYATRAGVVVTSTYSDSAGWYVLIDHLDGYKSVYMHMCTQPKVSVGDYVAQGQVIGCVGSTGWSTGNHLHFGFSNIGCYVNPAPFIGLG